MAMLNNQMVFVVTQIIVRYFWRLSVSQLPSPAPNVPSPQVRTTVPRHLQAWSQ
jgi:hypothetical protein